MYLGNLNLSNATIKKSIKNANDKKRVAFKKASQRLEADCMKIIKDKDFGDGVHRRLKKMIEDGIKEFQFSW